MNYEKLEADYVVEKALGVLNRRIHIKTSQNLQTQIDEAIKILKTYPFDVVEYEDKPDPAAFRDPLNE